MDYEKLSRNIDTFLNDGLQILKFDAGVLGVFATTYGGITQKIFGSKEVLFKKTSENLTDIINSVFIEGVELNQKLSDIYSTSPEAHTNIANDFISAGYVVTALGGLWLMKDAYDRFSTNKK